MRSAQKILIIDDSEDDRELYRRLLKDDERYDWAIIEAETGEDALNKLDLDDFACILLDYSLPGRDGLRVLSDIAEREHYAAVVMLTAQGNEAVAAQSLKDGAQDYLSKGVMTTDALRRAVHNALAQVDMLRRLKEQQLAQQTFAKVLAHDLKEPISVIRGMNNLILDCVRSRDFDEVEEFSLRIERSASRMFQLIQSLKEYNRSADGNVPFRPIDMNEVVLGALDDLEILLRDRNAKVKVDVLPAINGCAPQLIQLVQNLLTNAMKFCTADQPMIQISWRERQNFREFLFSDNGIGIQPEYRKSIFKPSYRLQSQDQYPGTGLGLSICKSIVERHRGQIWCEDNEIGGTTFVVAIPRDIEIAKAS